LLVISFGVAAGALLWSLSLLGYASFAPGSEWYVVMTWLPFVLLFGFTAWLVLGLTSGQKQYRPSAIARLRVALPVSGLGMSIFGIALHFVSFDPYGVVLSAVGLFVFLAGLTLAAAFPPEQMSVS
jgi:hypothetical protein